MCKRAKKDEETVADILKDFVYQREIHINYNCINSDDKHFARLDFVLELPTKRVILEVDERQHHDVVYEVKCDLARMLHVMAAIACSRNDRPTVWIRFNPDVFKVDGQTVKIPKKRKYQQLLSVLQDTTEFSGIRILYMYYDVTNKMPTICMDPSYDQQVKSMLSPPIVD